MAITFYLTMTADGGANGIPRETVDPIVAEGFRQLEVEAEIQTD